jgi:hypothetical protein
LKKAAGGDEMEDMIGAEDMTGAKIMKDMKIDISRRLKKSIYAEKW